MMERKHLTQNEVKQLISATKGARNEARDRCLLLLMFRHGLRVSETCGLEMSQVDVQRRIIRVHRLNSGFSNVQRLRTDEVKAIESWLAVRSQLLPSCDSFFLSERRKQLDRRTAWNAIRRYGEKAQLPLSIHPQMLRHACGHDLARQGADLNLIQHHLGHRNIKHTLQYADPTDFALTDLANDQSIL